MTTTTHPTPCTDAQKAEWSELHDRMRALRTIQESAESQAVYSLVKHVEAGAMTPGEFGLPSRDALDDYRRACDLAAEAARARAEWQALYAEAQAHPYTAEMNARRVEQ